MRTDRSGVAAVCLALAASACGGGGGPTTNGTAPSTPPPVQFVVFTHIEDNLPTGVLGTAAARSSYEVWRGNLLEMARLAQLHGVPWVLQPDWKYLEAALQFEDATLAGSTNGKNLFRHLVEDLGVIVDPHSHEAGGYNYADVAYLLTQLGVGGSTVVGGHVWDPSLPEYANWPRFNAPLAGERYPSFSWQAEILMGSATPGHVNDPEVSGVWRPLSEERFFEDSPVGSLVAVGGYKHELTAAEVSSLHDRYLDGTVASDCMLTAATHVQPADIATAAKRAEVESDVLLPLVALRDAGVVELTDYTRLVATWQDQFGEQACIVERLMQSTP